MALVPLPRISRPSRMVTLLYLTTLIGILSIVVATLAAMVLLTTDEWALPLHGILIQAQLAISAGAAAVFTAGAGFCYYGKEWARIALIPLAATNTVCCLVLGFLPIRGYVMGMSFPIPGFSDDIAFILSLGGAMLSVLVVRLLTRPNVRAGAAPKAACNPGLVGDAPARTER